MLTDLTLKGGFLLPLETRFADLNSANRSYAGGHYFVYVFAVPRLALVASFSQNVAMADIASVFGRYEFLVRRLHSLTGLLPVGAFLVVHLMTNAAILDTADTYQRRVDLIHSLGTYTLEVIEWLFIFLPILFHGIIGMIIVARGKRNVSTYSYRENIRYTLQRWTGVIAFAFIFWHVFQTRGWINSQWWLQNVTRLLGGGLFDPDYAVRHQRRSGPAGRSLDSDALRNRRPCGRLSSGQRNLDDGHYLGRVDRPQAQLWASLFCAGIGLVLAGFGLATVYGFWAYPVH